MIKLQPEMDKQNQNTKLIILHGWLQNRDYWNQFCTQISKAGVDAEIFELPGFGKEKLTNDEWGIPEYSNWVTQKIKAKSINNITLLGHSFGGRIAAYIASQNPKWLKLLILYGAPVLYRPNTKIKTKIFISKLLKPFVPKTIRKKIPKNPDLSEAEKLGLGKIFRKTVNFDQTDQLTKIKVPTFLIWGENDKEAKIQIAEEAHRLIPNSELIKLPNLGHNIHLESPNIFYGRIKKIIENNK